jgi:NADPH-dependent ferric siderophore reductase
MTDQLSRLADTVPSRPAGDLDDARLLAKSRDSAHWNLTVDKVDRIAPRMIRLTLSAAGLARMKYQPGQDLTVLVTRTAGRDIRRRYTIAGREHDAVQIDIYVHGEGIGSAWAQARRPGDVVSAIGPRGSFKLGPQADWHVFVGDETSLPGIHAMLAATDTPAQVVIEVDDPAQWESLGVGERRATRWTWMSRTSPLDPCDAVALPATGIGHAYISGEAQLVSAWREALECLGMAPSATTDKAYWGKGRVNATHGEPLV